MSIPQKGQKMKSLQLEKELLGKLYKRDAGSPGLVGFWTHGALTGYATSSNLFVVRDPKINPEVLKDTSTIAETALEGNYPKKLTIQHVAFDGVGRQINKYITEEGEEVYIDPQNLKYFDKDAALYACEKDPHVSIIQVFEGSGIVGFVMPVRWKSSEL